MYQMPFNSFRAATDAVSQIGRGADDFRHMQQTSLQRQAHQNHLEGCERGLRFIAANRVTQDLTLSEAADMRDFIQNSIHTPTPEQIEGYRLALLAMRPY